MKISSQKAKIMSGEGKNYDLSTRIIFVHSETRVTIPLEVDGSLIGKQGRGGCGNQGRKGGSANF